MSSLKPTIDKISHHFTAIYMVIFLVFCSIISTLTIINSHDKIIPEAMKYNDIMAGKWASEFETNFEDKLIIRDLTVGFWGAINYGIFKTGKDKVIVGKDGWLYTNEEFQHLANYKIAEDRLANVIYQTNKLLEAHNIKMIIALIPAKARIYPEYIGTAHLPIYRQNLYMNFRKRLLGQNIIAPDLYSPMLLNKNRTNIYMKQDTHWTPQGAKIVAEEIAKNLPNINFETSSFDVKTLDTKIVKGDLEKYIPTGVFKKYISPTPDTITPYLISKNNDKTQDMGDLFGEQNIPIALIGTSYSAIDTWDFEILLKHALQADVINMAIKGKGMLEPMAKFLKNTDLTNTNIKLVIWEIPERFIPVSYDDVIFPFEIEEK